MRGLMPVAAAMPSTAGDDRRNLVALSTFSRAVSSTSSNLGTWTNLPTPLRANHEAASGSTTLTLAINPPASPSTIGCQSFSLCTTISGASSTISPSPRDSASPVPGSKSRTAPAAAAIRGSNTARIRCVYLTIKSEALPARAATASDSPTGGSGTASASSPAVEAGMPALWRSRALAKTKPAGANGVRRRSLSTRDLRPLSSVKT
mmetsp:Transcript_30542/g.53627  ORF Transcript_30542/g.53627 Transcript_30542/m.53627 type:complete len:206 (+) Transcript_30542:553-1170(+)